MLPWALATASLCGCPPPKPYEDAGHADLPGMPDRGGDRAAAGDLAADTGADAAGPDSANPPDYKTIP